MKRWFWKGRFVGNVRPVGHHTQALLRTWKAWTLTMFKASSRSFSWSSRLTCVGLAIINSFKFLLRINRKTFIFNEPRQADDKGLESKCHFNQSIGTFSWKLGCYHKLFKRFKK
jgi:hypothetical protein